MIKWKKPPQLPFIIITRCKHWHSLYCPMEHKNHILSAFKDKHAIARGGTILWHDMLQSGSLAPDHYNQGRLSPQQPWRSSPPHSHIFPLFHHPSPRTNPTHANNFWTFYMQFCAILCVFSVNFGSCQSGIMTPKMKKYINGVGKTHCMLVFVSWG